MSRLASRIAALEARYRPAPSSPMTAAALDLLTDAELDELEALFRHHGAEWLADLPADAQARALALLDGAKARAVQSANPVTAGAVGA